MDSSIALALGSLKSLLLIGAAAGLSLALKGRPARLRAVVWATALAGSLLIPVAAPLLPAWTVPVAVDIHSLAARETPANDNPQQPMLGSRAERPRGTTISPALASRRASADWPTLVLAAWGIGVALMLLRLGVGLWRLERALGRGQPPVDPSWTKLLEDERQRVGCGRRVRLVLSDEVEIPATAGILRPVIVLPTAAHSWFSERRQAVLLHELVHIARFDWPLRVTARVARAVYWFNPLAWWAVRRLDLEQELACDEEVLALGTRPSNYACHLLGIARSAVRRPALATSGIEMARRSHLEERIMSILNNRGHRRVGLAVLLPAAVVVAAMVPALAAVHPGHPQSRAASPELQEVVTEIREAEERLAPHIERIEALELELQPHAEMIERIEARIDHDVMERIEAAMQPHLERLERIEIDMEPFHERLEELHTEMESATFHMEDGTLEEIQEQLHEQMADFHEQMERTHLEMAPFHEQMEQIHAEMEPFRLQMEELHEHMEPMHEELEQMHLAMEPFHEQMGTLHREMEPIHEELERMEERLDEAARVDVAAFLRDHLGAVTGPGAPFDEAAARIVEEAGMRLSDDSVEIVSSRGEVRQILSDLLAPHRVGGQDAFDEAVSATADALSPLVIQVD